MEDADLTRALDELFAPRRIIGEALDDLRPIHDLLKRLYDADDEVMGYVCWGHLADVIGDVVSSLYGCLDHMGKRAMRERP